MKARKKTPDRMEKPGTYAPQTGNESSAHSQKETGFRLTPANTMLISLGIFIFIMFVSAQTLKPQLDNPQFVIKEEPLNKSATLMIKPGEVYAYNFRIANVTNTSVNLTYKVMDSGACTSVGLVEAGLATCLDSGGNDFAGQNSTYNESSIILTKPWMLSVKEGWHWNISVFMIFDSIEKEVAATNYTFIRKEYFKGREAYVIRIRSSDGSEAVDWIDAEKRILLKEIGPDYEVEMISGLEPE